MLFAVPALLAGPLLLLAAALVSLTAQGPLGWLAAAGLLAVVGGASCWLTRLLRAWWRSTKAPDLAPPAAAPPRSRPHG